MKQSAKKIKKLEQLFHLQPPEVSALAARDLTPQQVSELKTLMDFIKAEAPLPNSLIQWLARLGLLYGVPFNNLVVDEKLLSHDIGAKAGAEAQRLSANNVLRFFYIDMHWIDSLIDGAISIGTHNSRDFKLQQAVHEAFRSHIKNEMLDHRQKIKGKPIVERLFPEKMGTLGGFLMRSPIIAQWPGIEIKGYKEVVATDDYGAKVQEIDQPDNIMEVLRMERLAMDTMLLIFKGVPKCILIKEPSESVYSGLKYVKTVSGGGHSGLQYIKAASGGGDPALQYITKVETQESGYELTLRHVKGENRIGKPIMKQGKDSAEFYKVQKKDFRNLKKRVLNLTKLRTNLLEKLKKEDPKIKKLSPKDMAVQLINSPRYHFFQNKQ